MDNKVKCQKELEYILQVCQEYIDGLKPAQQHAVKAMIDTCMVALIKELQLPVIEENITE